MDARNDIAALSVKRPLLVTVLNLLIVLAGLAALFGVEIRELPDVDRPVVSVSASLPGAAPETMDAEVTSVLEGAAARVSGVREIRSSSEENNSRIHVEFNPGVNLDIAAADVREAISQVTRDLPDRVEQLAIRKSDEDADPIIDLAVKSSVYDEESLTRIIDQDILPELLAVEGVASVEPFGARERQLHVVVDPLRLSRFNLTVSDVAGALQGAPFDVPVGSFRSEDQELIVRAEATAATPERVEEVIIAGDISIGDVADAYFAPADASSFVRLDDEPIIGLGVVRQAQSNTINISNAVTRRVERLNERLEGLEIVVTSDDAVFIRDSVSEVLITLCFTILIVVATIWLFFGSWKATLAPGVAIPVSLIGTVAGIWMLGFSINLLTLLALVLATGLIVDDAIVVLENIQRKQSQGVRSKAAAVLGSRQVLFAVIATTAVLVSVFVPISLLPSTAGRLFREFGFVLALSVILSSFVALSLTPAIAARLDLKPASSDRNRVEKIGGRIQSTYDRLLSAALDKPFIAGGVSLLVGAIAVWTYLTLPQELVPEEDRGAVYVFATGPDGVGLDYMERQADQIEAVLQPLVDSGEVESIYTIVGRYDPNRVGVTAKLVPWSERDRSQQDIIAALQPQMSEIPGSRVSVFGRGSLDIGGGRSGLEVALTGATYDRIYENARALSDAIETRSDILSNPEISYQPTQPQLSVQIDRRRAADLGVPLNELSTTLRAMVGGDEIVDLNVGDQAIPIFLKSRSRAITSPADLQNLFVRNEDGDLIPLSSLTRIVEEGVAAELDRTEQRRAIEVEADIAQGTALADAVAEIQRLGRAVMTDDVDMVLQGEAETLSETSRELFITYGFALLIVFLVLVAQFESLTSPVVIMLTVPFGVAAAIFALAATGVSLNIYSQIGLIMLIGLMAKNGILIVEFADQLRSEGRSLKDAVHEAAVIRLRPISMTLLSTMFGAVPLVIASGAGAEARSSIGWVIFGGLGLAAIFTLFLNPVLYLGFARFGEARSVGAKQLQRELDEAERKGVAAETGPAE